MVLEFLQNNIAQYGINVALCLILWGIPPHQTRRQEVPWGNQSPGSLRFAENADSKALKNDCHSAWSHRPRSGVVLRENAAHCYTGCKTTAQLFHCPFTIPIRNGVRQGGSMSPKLIIAALQRIMKSLYWNWGDYRQSESPSIQTWLDGVQGKEKRQIRKWTD